jgi:hypothetical protein
VGLAIEADRKVNEFDCPDCGVPIQRVTGFVLRDDKAYAVYYASCYHHGGHEAWFDVIFSPTWAEGVDDHETFGCRVGPIEGQAEPGASLTTGGGAFRDSQIFGRKLSRDEALTNPRLAEFWEVVDYILSTTHWYEITSTGQMPCTAWMRRVASVRPNPYLEVEQALRALPSDQQRDVAVALATLVLPFAGLTPTAQPSGGLVAVASEIREAVGMTAIDHARHRLFSIPELASDHEPAELAWFTFYASVTWIYAADAKATAPGDGVVNAFKSVTTVLDGLDQDLGDTTLTDRLVQALADANGAIDPRWLTAFAADIQDAVSRLV